MSKGWSVYRLKFPNGKIYIGITSRLKERWRSYRYASEHGGNRLVLRAIHKYGWASIEATVLAEGLLVEDAGACEKALIVALKTQSRNHGYNVADGGIVNAGFSRPYRPRGPFSEDHKNRMRAAAVKRGRGHLDAIRVLQPVIVTDSRSGETVQYDSISECARSLGCLIHTVHNHVRRNSRLLDRRWTVRRAA